jgi:nucleoside 2-deoxyribosyltransferase
MTISITGEPHLELAIDEAKAFLLALRNGDSPIVIADSRTAFQLEFAIAEDRPTFTISKPGQEHTVRRFNAGWSYDVKAMAAHLLAELGP